MKNCEWSCKLKLVVHNTINRCTNKTFLCTVGQLEHHEHPQRSPQRLAQKKHPAFWPQHHSFIKWFDSSRRSFGRIWVNSNLLLWYVYQETSIVHRDVCKIEWSIFQSPGGFMNSSFSSVCNPICEVSATTQFIKKSWITVSCAHSSGHDCVLVRHSLRPRPSTSCRRPRASSSGKP